MILRCGFERRPRAVFRDAQLAAVQGYVDVTAEEAQQSNVVRGSSYEPRSIQFISELIFECGCNSNFICTLSTRDDTKIVVGPV